MSLIQPCDFSDPKLTRFKGMCWADFVNHVANQKAKKSDSSYSVASGSSSEGSQSPHYTTTGFTNNPISGPVKDPPAPPAVSTTEPPVNIPPPAVPPPAATGVNLTPSPTSSIKGKSSPKPLVRKRMGLMRTMSDRYLERRITPALWRATPGFRLGEKLVEGKEPDTDGTGAADAADNEPEKGKTLTGKPPLISTKSEKDLFSSEHGSSSGAPTKDRPIVGPTVAEDMACSNPDIRQKMRQKEALWDLFQSECSFLYDHLMVLKNVSTFLSYYLVSHR